MNPDLRAAVEPVVAAVVRADYKRLAEWADPRVTPADTERAVAGYGANFVPLTEAEYAAATIVEVSPAVSPDTWSVWLPLRSAEEGTSDLTVQVTIRRALNGEYHVELDGILVP